MPDGASTSSRVQPASLFYTAFPHPVSGRPAATETLQAAFERAASLGFSHANIPPPWASARHDRLLACSLKRLDPALAPATTLADLAAAARKASLKLVIDVLVDRLSPQACAEGDAGSAQGAAIFAEASLHARLDPRSSARHGVASAHLESPADAAALGRWWAERLATWSEAGVAGFRLLGLDRIPEALLAPLISTMREAIPATLLHGWTPGLTRSALARLRGAGLDGVYASLPWWDCRAPWLWDELDALRRIAPVIGVDAVPLGPQPHGPALGRAMALAATLGEGWMHVDGGEADLDAARLAGGLNRILRISPALTSPFAPSLPAGDGGAIRALLCCDAADPRSASEAALVIVNTDLRRPGSISAAALLTATGGRFPRFTAALGALPEALEPGLQLALPPGGAEIFLSRAATSSSGIPPGAISSPSSSPAGGLPAGQISAAPPRAASGDAASWPRLAIEGLTPCVDGGLFPVKAIAGEIVAVEADILFDGHEKIAACLRWRAPGEAEWREAPMRALGNDRWTAALPLACLGRHDYKVAAWRDPFETFRDELAKKLAAGLDISLELIEGRALLASHAEHAAEAARDPAIGAAIGEAIRQFDAAGQDARAAILLAPPLAQSMAKASDRPFLVETAAMPVDSERLGARFASWYEIFPRSMSDDTARHGTFRDVERHLPRIRDMGFDVLYFPPIHPIGRTNRKGPNNTLTPGPDDPGSPYAVGSQEGGHETLHPALGNLADFQHLRHEAAAHGLELAMDFAIQCSPDHPWLVEHPGWFDWRPDGTIRYAENPPKKYEDIVNVDFYASDAVPDLWQALCDVVLFWAGQGVRLFRVDNPHTKPFPFWDWMIGEVRRQYPDAIFLAEAFTRPKIMYRLAKIGFSQSYTYFTWRNTRSELEAYFSELAQTPPRDFFRPHLFVNTPDINPVFLHDSGRAGFLIRAALAATLSGLWGVYSGFELCEATPVKPGKEEYLDSEKYQLRAWDWDRPGNIAAEIGALNRMRRRNPALQTHLGVSFLSSGNDRVLYFEKATPDRSNVVLVAVSLDPYAVQEARIELPLWKFGLPDDGRLVMEDQLGRDGAAGDGADGASSAWASKYHHLRFAPESPYAVWRTRREDA